MKFILVGETGTTLDVVVVLPFLDREMVCEAISVGPQQLCIFVLYAVDVFPAVAVEVMFDIVLHIAFAIEHFDLLAIVLVIED